MNLNKYQEMCLRTTPNGDQERAQIYRLLSTPTDVDYFDGLKEIHSLLGLMDEVGELANAINNEDLPNIKEEIGDAFWYTALGATANGVTLLSLAGQIKDVVLVNDPNVALMDLMGFVASYASASKKTIFYRKSTSCTEALTGIVLCLLWLCDYYGFTVDEVLSDNQYKLQQRYPENFTEEDAIERKDKEDGE